MKCMSRALLAGAATVLLLSGVASAADFPAMDADKDGKITWEEYQKVNPSMRKAGFDAMDFDKDGGITEEELNKFRGKHAKEGGMGGTMGGPKGGPMGGKTMPPMSGKGVGKGMPPMGSKPMIMPPAQPGSSAPSPNKSNGAGKMLITPPKQ